jgi:hypothetical protein
VSVRYGAKQVGYRTPAPQVTKRRHETPAKGDCQSAIMRASGGCLDFNLQLIRFKTGTQPVGAHWADLKKDGFTHCHLPGQKLRRITRAEYKKYPTLQKWVTGHGGEVRALNALKKRGGGRFGKSKAINDYPMTWVQAVRFADRCDTVLTPELKSPGFAKKTVAATMAQVCRTLDYPLWPMTLLSMAGAEQKVAAFVSQKLQCALIFGTDRWMAKGRNRVKGWRYKPTVIWGPASARAWLRR